MAYRERIGPWLAKKEIVRKLAVTQKELTIFDVGAHKGNVTEYYQRMWPKAEYHLFEPLPKSAQGLRDRFQGQERVHVHEMAVGSSSRPEPVVMYVGGQTTEMSSLLERPQSRRYFRHNLDRSDELVRVASLDDFVKANKIPNVHILKADIQGAEGEMLKGAKYVLQYKKPLMLYLEVFFVSMYEGSMMFWELCRFLERYGYTLFDLYGLGRSKVNRQLKYGDALFVSREVRADVLDAYPPEWQPKSLELAMGGGGK